MKITCVTRSRVQISWRAGCSLRARSSQSSCTFEGGRAVTNFVSHFVLTRGRHLHFGSDCFFFFGRYDYYTFPCRHKCVYEPANLFGNGFDRCSESSCREFYEGKQRKQNSLQLKGLTFTNTLSMLWIFLFEKTV